MTTDKRTTTDERGEADSPNIATVKVQKELTATVVIEMPKDFPDDELSRVMAEVDKKYLTSWKDWQLDGWDFEVNDAPNDLPRFHVSGTPRKWTLEAARYEQGPRMELGEVHREVVDSSNLDSPIRYQVVPALSCDDELTIAVAYDLGTHLLAVAFSPAGCELRILDGSVISLRANEVDALPFVDLKYVDRYEPSGDGLLGDMHRAGLLLKGMDDDDPMDANLYDYFVATGDIKEDVEIRITSLQDGRPPGFESVFRHGFRIAKDPNELLRRPVS